jgi:hypothetical protein
MARTSSWLCNCVGVVSVIACFYHILGNGGESGHALAVNAETK